MAQRNAPCSSQLIDSDSNPQDEGYVYSDPCIFLGDFRNFPLPDVQVGMPALGNPGSLDAHPSQEHYDSSVFYGIPQYPTIQHQHHVPNLDLVVGPPSNFYAPYLATPSSLSVSHGSVDQVLPPSNYTVMGVSADEYGRNCQLVDNFRCSYNKRKNFEGIPGNFQYFNAPSVAGSSFPPFNARSLDGVAPADAAAYNVPQYRGNGTSFRELGSQRSVRNRAGAAMDPIMGQNPNYFQGNYISQHYYPAIDGSSSSWGSPPNIPYMQGSNIGCPVDNSNRSSSTHIVSSPVNIRHPNIYHPSSHIQGVRAHNINTPHLQVAAVSPQVPVSISSQGTVNRSQDGLGMGLRYMRPSPPSGLRVYRSHQEGALTDSNPRHRNFPQLRVLPPDGVAILEFPEFYDDVSFIDHHRDMRLDIEDMSYEELLALGERIGNVNTGLSEETITAKLKTRTYSTSTLCINLEETPMDQEIDSCIICQDDFKKQEGIGALDCGHEYHADCLKKWLVVKNVCPICKCEALAAEKKDGS